MGWAPALAPVAVVGVRLSLPSAGPERGSGATVAVAGLGGGAWWWLTLTPRRESLAPWARRSSSSAAVRILPCLRAPKKCLPRLFRSPFPPTNPLLLFSSPDSIHMLARALSFLLASSLSLLPASSSPNLVALNSSQNPTNPLSGFSKRRPRTRMSTLDVWRVASSICQNGGLCVGSPSPGLTRKGLT